MENLSKLYKNIVNESNDYRNLDLNLAKIRQMNKGLRGLNSHQIHRNHVKRIFSHNLLLKMFVSAINKINKKDGINYTKL